MPDPIPEPSPAAKPASRPETKAKPRIRYHDLARVVARNWATFFSRFRPDEHAFELAAYRQDSTHLAATLAALGPGEEPDPGTCVVMLELLDQFAQRRFEEQNQRIDELMDLCEQMRARLEVSELKRSHHEDELGHCMAIAKTALAAHDLEPPANLPHPPRVHNLFNHLLAHLEPSAKRMDTATYRKVASPKPEEPPSLFDYDRLRKLFRKG